GDWRVVSGSFVKGGAWEPRGPGPNRCNARISTSLCLSSGVLAEGSASLGRSDMAHATGGGARPRSVNPSPQRGDRGEVHLTLAFEQRFHSQTAPTPKSRRYQDEQVSWEMVSTAAGELAGAGLEVLVLDDQGRIVTDSQFVER